jgi:hypothetical protein
VAAQTPLPLLLLLGLLLPLPLKDDVVSCKLGCAWQALLMVEVL